MMHSTLFGGIRVGMYMGHSSKILMHGISRETCNKMLNNQQFPGLWERPMHKNHTPHTEFMFCSWLRSWIYQLQPRTCLQMIPDWTTSLCCPHGSRWSFSRHYSGQSLNVCTRLLVSCNCLIMPLCFRTTDSHSGTSIQLLLVFVYSSVSRT